MSYDRITDAAAGKSSTWPGGEPQKIRDLADAKQAEQGQGGGKFTAVQRAARRIAELRRVAARIGRARPDHLHDYRTDFWGGFSCWCGDVAPEGTVPS